MTEKQFMDEFTEFIHQKVKEVKESNTGIVFKKDREPVGICPWCESDLYRYEEKEGDKKFIRYYCSNKGSCSFSLQTDNPTVTNATGKKLTEKQLQKLIAYGFTTLNCKSRYENGSDFKGKFEIVKRDGKDKEGNPKVYANISYTPIKAAKKKKSLF